MPQQNGKREILKLGDCLIVSFPANGKLSVVLETENLYISKTGKSLSIWFDETTKELDIGGKEYRIRNGKLYELIEGDWFDKLFTNFLIGKRETNNPKILEKKDGRLILPLDQIEGNDQLRNFLNGADRPD